MEIVRRCVISSGSFADAGKLTSSRTNPACPAQGRAGSGGAERQHHAREGLPRRGADDVLPASVSIDPTVTSAPERFTSCSS